MITAFDYDLAILAMRGGEQRMANLRKLMRLAAEYEEHEGRDLRGFLDFAEERTRRDEREGMAAVRVEGHDGVRVMTVHAAKGLEFPVVAVADLGRGLGAAFAHPDLVVGRLAGPVGDPSGARFGMRVPVAAAEPLRLWELVELCDAEADAEVEEALRLVYVAATRAQERLILSGRCRLPADEAPESLRGSHTALQLLLPALPRAAGRATTATLLSRGPPRWAEARRAVRRHGSGSRIQRAGPERAAELRARHDAEAPAPQDPIEPREPLLPESPRRAGAGHLSYSALRGMPSCGYRFYVERVLGLASPLDRPAQNGEPSAPDEPEGDELLDPELGPRERSLAVGNAVHALLEAAARQSWDAVQRRSSNASLPARASPATGMRLSGSRAWSRTGSGPACARSSPPAGRACGRGAVHPRARRRDRPRQDRPAGRHAARARSSSTTRRTRSTAPTRPSWRAATGRSATSTRWRCTGRAGRSAPVRAAYCFLEAPDRTVLERYDEAGSAPRASGWRG